MTINVLEWLDAAAKDMPQKTALADEKERVSYSELLQNVKRIASYIINCGSFKNCPIAVLMNEDSASAAEIFSGAVKDHGVGTLVGTTTFGKGIVQQTFSLGDGSAVKLTTSRYYTPNGVNIQGTGITPDVEIDWPEDAEEFTNPNQFNELSQEEWESKDAQMKKAREVLSEKVAQAEQ